MNSLSKSKKLYASAAIIMVLIISLFSGLYFWLKHTQKIEIGQTELGTGIASGRILTGKNSAKQSNKLVTSEKLVFESKNIETRNNNTSAVYLTWQQSKPDEKVKTEIRAFDGKSWSDWYDASTDSSERPDHAPVTQRGAFIAGANMSQIQYRMSLEGSAEKPSTEVNLDTLNLKAIDASHGTNPIVTAIDATLKNLGIIQTVSARGAGPNIVSREGWGCPEPTTDGTWTDDEYRSLNRVIIHHTAVIPGADSAAAVRSIWQYHAKNLGWGDIGYNYLVDQTGRIFEGRLYDHSYAEQHNVDIVGGHAYGNNYGTTGFSALGDFDKMRPTANLIHSMGELAAYKMGSYGLNPAGGETYGGNLLGHRDVYPTACPGAHLYANLNSIRSVASALFPRYVVPQYAWQYMNQKSYTDAARTQPVDLNTATIYPGQKYYMTVYAKNTGTQAWYPGGANPVRLGTSRPSDRKSDFYTDMSWLGYERAAQIAEPAVMPGQIGSFMYTMTVPERMTLVDANIDEYFTPLAEGRMWMNDPGLFWRFRMPASYKWEYVTQNAYLDADHKQPINLNTTTVKPGEMIYLSVEAKNVGSKTWQSDGANPVRLGTSNAYDRNSVFCGSEWLGCNRPVSISKAVKPLESGTFDFSVTIPENKSGAQKVYKEYFSPLAEGYVWMNNPGLYWQFTVDPETK